MTDLTTKTEDNLTLLKTTTNLNIIINYISRD